MTPCEKLGYKVGDKFQVINGSGNHNVEKLQVITLQRDDGDDFPMFTHEHGSLLFCAHIGRLKKIGVGENSLLATRYDIIEALRETGAKLSLEDAMEIAETLLDKFNIEK